MPTPSTVATVNNTPFGTGLGSQTHIVYAPNSGLWWAFWLDSSDLTTLRSAYGNSTSWTVATSLTLAANHDSDGRRFDVWIDSIAGIDVLHVVRVLGTTPFTVYHARATMSGTTITWGTETDTGVVSTSASALGASITLDSNNVPIISYTGASGFSVIRATNADLGTSWVDGWGAPTTIAADASESTAVIPFAGGVLVALGDNDAATPNWTNLDWSSYTGTWSIAASMRPTNLGTAEPIADWAWAATATDALVLIRTGVKTFEGRDFNGTSWSQLTNLGTMPINTVAGNGVATATDGTSLWAFCLGNTGDVYYNRLNHIGGAWTGWIALGLSGATRTGLGAYQSVVSGTIVLYWTEGATSPYTFVTYPFNTQVPAVPTDLDCTAQNGQLTVRWNAPLYVGASAVSSYTVSLTAPGFPLGFAASQTTPDGNTLTATFTGLTNGRTYTAIVVATNSSGNSDASAGVLCTPYFSPDGSGPGAGFSGRMWGGADASTPPGYVWGNIGAPGGDWNRWQMLGQYRPQLAFQSPNPPFPLLTGVRLAGGFQLGDLTIGSAAALLLPAAGAVTLNAMVIAGQATAIPPPDTVSGGITLGSLAVSTRAAEIMSAAGALTLGNFSLSASAAQVFSAAGTVTLGAFVVSSVAAEVFAATGALTLGTVVVSAAAAAIIAASGGPTLGAFTVGVSAAQSFPASAALTLATILVSAAAVEIITASVGPTLGTMSAGSAAVETLAAAAALVLGAFSVAGTAAYMAVAAGITLGTFAVSATAAEAMSAAGAVQLGDLVVGTTASYSSAAAQIVLGTLGLASGARLIVAASGQVVQADLIVGSTAVFAAAAASMTLGDLAVSGAAGLLLSATGQVVLGDISPGAAVAYSAAMGLLQLGDLVLGGAAALVEPVAGRVVLESPSVGALAVYSAAAGGIVLDALAVAGAADFSPGPFVQITLGDLLVAGAAASGPSLSGGIVLDAPRVASQAQTFWLGATIQEGPLTPGGAAVLVRTAGAGLTLGDLRLGGLGSLLLAAVAMLLASPTVGAGAVTTSGTVSLVLDTLRVGGAVHIATEILPLPPLTALIRATLGVATLGGGRRARLRAPVGVLQLRGDANLAEVG